jgi:hypothetical protein
MVLNLTNTENLKGDFEESPENEWSYRIAKKQIKSCFSNSLSLQLLMPVKMGKEINDTDHLMK